MHDEHLLFLHSQGEKGNESETAIEERIEREEQKMTEKSGLQEQPT